MATKLLDNGSGDVVELSSTDGVAFIEQASPLTRLHYFDGQFLRASSLTTEQDYHRHAVQLANLAGGWGVVNGFGISLAGDQLAVGAGLAITPAGNFVLAGMDMKAKLADLLGSAQPAPVAGSAAFGDCLEAKPTTKATTGLQVYEITVGPVEGLCGNEAVFGKLCDTACATDSRRPYWREGVVLRLRPISLTLPDSSAVKALTAHQRNRIASAYFAREPGQPGSLLSAAGLASGVWCEPAQLYNRDEVVIGLLWREAGVARIDAWSGRRERMDTQPRGYWQGRMAMRPWNVFIAQILQFQCQLSGLFDANNPVILPDDDCRQIRDVLSHARREIETMLARFGGSAKQILQKAEGKSLQELRKASADFSASYADLNGLSATLATLDSGSGVLPQQRMLINAGFFELPPAGYLPVSTNSDVQEQCQRMFGEGCKLHFHAVHSDEIAHLVEEAEHMKRISLTRGLDDPSQLEAVEIFVPEGQVGDAATRSPGTWWQLRSISGILDVLEVFSPKKAAAVATDVFTPAQPAEPAKPAGKAQAKSRAKATAALTGTVSTRAGVDDAEPFVLDGLLRTENREDGSAGFAFAISNDTTLNAGMRRLAKQEAASREMLYFSGDIQVDPFSLPVGGSTDFKAEVATTFLGRDLGIEGQLKGVLTVLAQQVRGNGVERRLVQLDNQFVMTRSDGTAPRTDLSRFRLVLQRDGDGRAGVLRIEPGEQGLDLGPMSVDWQESPREATLDAERESELRRKLLEKDETTGADADADAAVDIVHVLQMSALPAMPDPTSTLGTATLNVLAALADANDDAALLMRSRQRLFPVLGAPKTQSVKALLDWVMFRRARTHLCGPACTTQAPAALESFQVWHLNADTMQIVELLKKALDSGDDKTLAQFKFQRVGLLRYRDESAFSEETAEQVLQMWRLARPDARVALGRVWEVAPTTGQGWQNHMRLRHMLEQIDSLTKAPPSGDGSLAVMAPPSGQLADRTSDGGMLVLTLPGEVSTHTHRTVFLPIGLYSDVVPTLKKDAAAGMAMLERVLRDPAAGGLDLDAHFNGDTLDNADLKPLVEADDKQRQAQNRNINVRVYSFRVDATPVPSGIHPDVEHEVIAKLLKLDMSPAPNGPNDGSIVAPVADLGRGAAVLTLLGYQDIS